MESVLLTCLCVFEKAKFPIDIKNAILNDIYPVAKKNTSNQNCVSKEFAIYLRKLFKTTFAGGSFYAVRIPSGELFPVIEMPGFSTMKQSTDDMNFIQNRFQIDFCIQNYNIFA